MKACQKIQSHKNDYLSSKKSETMEVGLRLRIKELETKLRHYRRDNEDLRDMNTKSVVMSKLHEIQERFKEHNIYDQKKTYRKIVCINRGIKRQK